MGLIISSACVSCSNKAQEFNRLCQEGWGEQSRVSDTIYNKLSLQKYNRYISIKGGNDRGAYSFYFMGQTNNAGLFIHVDEHQIKTISITSIEANEIFDLLTPL